MAQQSKKRKFSEIEQIDDVNGPLPNSSIQGAITSLSPVKPGRKSSYFDGMLADDTSKIRFVGFEPLQQKKLVNFLERNVPVQIDNCEIKTARQGEGYEVMLKSSSIIKESPKKLVVSTLRQTTTEEVMTISLEEISTLDDYQKVNVSIKVISVNAPDTISDLSHQDVFVADQTGSVRVCLWNNYINSLKQGESYNLTSFSVREFRSKKYLNMPRSGAEIAAINDLGSISEAPPEEEQKTTIENVQVVGVPTLDMYKACLQCKARVEPLTPPFGKCSKRDCDMIQRYDLCTDQATARLLLMYTSGDRQQRYITCHVFGQLINKLASLSLENEISSKALLSLPQLKSVTFVKDKLIMTAFDQ